MRTTSAILAAGIVAAAATAPVAAVASPHPSGTPAPPHPSVTPASQHPSETVSPLAKQPLPNVKGKTFTSEIVYFPPNARAAPHRHGSAFVYAYVLQGTVRSQLAGEPVRTYHQGQNWVEPPGAHHLLTENTSWTKPAKLLVTFISDTGAELKIND
jgi:quercetin dioxygenase-like cupin family protein